MTRPPQWLCPAPTETGRCWTPLPCTEHHVLDPEAGFVFYGASYLAGGRA